MNRRGTTWSGALYGATIVAGLLITAVWAMSFWWIPTYTHFGGDKPIIQIRYGCVAVWIGFSDPNDDAGFSMEHCHGDWSKSGGLARGKLGLTRPYVCDWWYQRLIVIPLWIPWSAATLLALGLGYQRRRRRFPPGYCTHCGYNLCGNVSGVCPECGLRIG